MFPRPISIPVFSAKEEGKKERRRGIVGSPVLWSCAFVLQVRMGAYNESSQGTTRSLSGKGVIETTDAVADSAYAVDNETREIH